MWMPGSKEVGSGQDISSLDQDRSCFSPLPELTPTGKIVIDSKEWGIGHDIDLPGKILPRPSPPSGGEQYSPAAGCGRGVLFVE